MSGDPGDLANLRDLALPPPVSFWPPAAGIWILAAGCLAVLAILLWRAAERYRAAAYRRAAIAELDDIAAAIDRREPGIAERVSAVMKRVAMVERSRARVASLTGQAWLDFIADAGAGSDTTAIRRALGQAYAAQAAPDRAEQQRLVAQASRWVRAHRAPAGSGA